MMDTAPLQLYYSGLIFAPRQTTIRRCFGKQIPGWICRLPEVESAWNGEIQTLEGHSDEVKSVVFSSDGKLIASGSGDGTIKIWDSTTGSLQSTLEDHSGPVRSVVFSPDGRYIASGSYDCTVKLWDTAGALRYTLKDHSGSVGSIVFSPDGRYIASGSHDHTVKLWDTTGALKYTLKDHSDSVNSVVFSPDGRYIASGSEDHTVKLWDTARSVQSTLEGHSGPVYCVLFSPDGRHIASCSEDSTVRLWDTVGTPQYTLEHSRNVETATFSPDSTLVATGSFDGTVRLWDTTQGTLQHDLKGDDAYWVLSVAFSPDGKQVASGYLGNMVKLWDTKTGALQCDLKGHSKRIAQVLFSPIGRLVASGSWDSTIKLWDTTQANAQPAQDGHSDKVLMVVFSPNGKLVASASADHGWTSAHPGILKLWDTNTGNLLHTLQGVSGVSRSDIAVEFSPDSKLVAFRSAITLRVWDVNTGTPQRAINLDPDRMETAKFPPDSELVAFIARFGHTGKPRSSDTPVISRTVAQMAGMDLVNLSPDNTLVTCCHRQEFDYVIKCWDIATGTLQYILNEPSGSDSVPIVKFSPDSKLTAFYFRNDMISCWVSRDNVSFYTGDNTIKLLDSNSGTLLGSLGGHSDSLTTVKFSLDGKSLASGSRDGIVKLWNIPTGTPQHTLPGHMNSITNVAFSSDGKLVASSSHDKSIKLWNADTGMLHHTFPVEDVADNLIFSTDGPFLNTSQGSFRIQPPYSGFVSLVGHKNADLFLGYYWIALQDKEMLWLPHQYRPTAWAVRDGTVFIGSSSGQGITMELGTL